eukprot:SM000084S23172  [mRNA]  locus=s84:449748:451333:- [translate_table: standard]
MARDEDGAAGAQGGPPPSSRELLDALAATADAQRAIARLSVEAHDREHERELAHLVRPEAVEAKARQLRAVSDVLRSLTANKSCSCTAADGHRRTLQDKLLVQLQQPKVEPCIPVEIAHQQDFYQLVKRAAAEAGNLVTAHEAVAWALAFDAPASSWQSSLQEHTAATSAILQHHEALTSIRATFVSSMHRGGIDDAL